MHRTVVTLYVAENAGEEVFRVCHILLDKAFEVGSRLFPAFEVGVEMLLVRFEVQLEVTRFPSGVSCSFFVGDCITTEKCGRGLFNAVFDKIGFLSDKNGCFSGFCGDICQTLCPVNSGIPAV